MNGRETGGGDGGGGGGGGGGEELRERLSGESGLRENHAPAARVPSADLMVHSPPCSPRYSRSPMLFSTQPQVPTPSLSLSLPPIVNLHVSVCLYNR